MSAALIYPSIMVEARHPWLSRRTALRRMALAGMGGVCVAGTGALWLRAASQGALSAEPSRQGFSTIDHQLGWTKGVQFGGMFMAQEHGFLEREQLTAKFLAGGPGTDYRTIVAGGRALVSESNCAGMIEAAVRGQPILSFGAIYQRDPGCIISPAARPIRSLEDMVGKTIGLPNSVRFMISAIMRSVRIDPARVRFVPVGSDAAMLAEGQIDGYFNWATTAVPALTISGFETHQLHMDEIGAPGYGALLIARRDRIESNPDLFVRYVRALISGWQWMVDHPAETARIVVEKYADPGRSLAEQTLQAKTIVRYVRTGDALTKGMLWLDPAIFEGQIRLARDSGVIPAGFRVTPDMLMTQTIVREALK